jgi:hypothetical protein
MLLPQSQAYKTLSDRLTTVSSLHMHIGLTGFSVLPLKNENNTTVASSVDLKITENDNLIKNFENVQEKHVEFRLRLLRQKSLKESSDVKSALVVSTL